MSSIARLYNTTALVQRKGAATTNSYGEPVASFATHISSVRCRIEGIGGGMSAEMVDRIQATEATNYMYCGPADIKETDRVIFGSITFEVKFVNSRPGGLTKHMEILLMEVRA